MQLPSQYQIIKSALIAYETIVNEFKGEGEITLHMFGDDDKAFASVTVRLGDSAHEHEINTADTEDEHIVTVSLRKDDK